MATHTATEGKVTVGGTGVGSIKSMGLETTAETIDTTVLNSTAKTFAAGTTSFTGSVEGLWDETDAGQLALVEGTPQVVVFAFEGTTSGDYIYSGSAFLTSVSISSAVDGMVEASFSFTGTGALTRGTA